MKLTFAEMRLVLNVLDAQISGEWYERYEREIKDLRDKLAVLANQHEFDVQVIPPVGEDA